MRQRKKSAERSPRGLKSGCGARDRQFSLGLPDFVVKLLGWRKMKRLPQTTTLRHRHD